MMFPFVLGAQVSVNFSPAIYGQNMEGLLYAQITNSSGVELKASVTIKISEISGPVVATIRTPSFVLLRGANFINRLAFSNAKFQFYENYYSKTFSQSRRLPEGEYEFCFDVDISESKADQFPPFYEYCFVSQVQPLTPLLLISPADADQICNKRPDLTWQLPMPFPIAARCRLLLTELKENQDVVEAINYNQPIINQSNLFSNTLFYPSSAPDLLEGHKYVWQVTAYSNGTVLKKSEVWTFTIKCEEQPKDVSTESYRELKEVEDGNFYVAKKILHFSVQNPYGAGILDYSISDMLSPGKVVKNLPALKLFPGLNKYDLDLSDQKAFKNDQEYLIEVRLANGRELKLRFIYKSGE
jgi:hypothetical protein